MKSGKTLQELAIELERQNEVKMNMSRNEWTKLNVA
jgi:hypothetical protein